MSLLIKNCSLRHREGLWDIYCENKKINKIGQDLDQTAETTIDADGKLLVPAFIEPHIHLDKVNILDSVPKNVSGTLTEAIEIIWDRKKKYTNEDVIERAGAVLDRAIMNGTLAVRTHIDIDTIGGLKPLEGVLALRERYKDKITFQLIAFPQEGIIKNPGCDELLDKAMQMGCEIVGGMPANEYTPEDSLAHVKYCFDLAEKYDADVDMHVDETDDPFYRTLEMVADETIKRGWEGRVTCGHTCALAAYDDHYASYVIDKVVRAGLHMITNPVTNLMLQGRNDKQPIRRGITRVKELLEAGVNISFGQDCVNDTFYPLGCADMLQVANVTVHAAQMSLPEELDKVFDMITTDANKILKLEGYGLEEGSMANLVVIDAKNIREAIALCPNRPYIIKEGKIIVRNERITEYFY
ncbi:MAG TPA: amidohydrolase family protein [Candidatus Eisenbacteria bacterium]|nr:amidohydrolase family protein [Candidatus Eisenbacteria bacterium]